MLEVAGESQLIGTQREARARCIKTPGLLLDHHRADEAIPDCIALLAHLYCLALMIQLANHTNGSLPNKIHTDL